MTEQYEDGVIGPITRERIACWVYGENDSPNPTKFREGWEAHHDSLPYQAVTSISAAAGWLARENWTNGGKPPGFDDSAVEPARHVRESWFVRLIRKLRK